MSPRVSVIITAYNNEQYIGQAIESILTQDYQDYEIIVVEDRGRDNTYTLAKAYASERVHVFRNQYNLGQHRNKNEGLGRASGDLVKFLDADDYVLAGGLKHLVATYDAGGTEAVAVFARPRLVDEHGYELERVPGWGFSGRADGPSLLHFLTTTRGKGSCLCNVSPHIFSRTALLRVGGFPESNAYAGDWEVFLKLLAIGDAVFTDGVVAAYRIQSESISHVTSVVSQASDGLRSAKSVREFVMNVCPRDERFVSETFWRGLLGSFVGRYVANARLRSLVRRKNCFAELASVFVAEGLESEFARVSDQEFPSYLLTAMTHKVRTTLGLPRYTPCLTAYSNSKLSHESRVRI
jgi:glycosyltransferase involved in cell wall biosynthesis